MPGFAIVHANHMEDLRDLVVERIKRAPPDPLATETFLVPGNGIAQWLRLALAEGLGICGATRFLLPGRFLREAASALGAEAGTELTGAPLVWRLMALLEANADPLLAPVRHYLADDTDGRRRLALATRLAGCFERYQVYRPDWLRTWEQNRSVTGLDHPAEAWEALLWRQLVAAAGPVARPADLINAVPANAPADLPARVFAIGFSSLPPLELEALARLGQWMDVCLFVLNPSHYYWGDIVETGDTERRALRRGRQPAHADAPEPDEPSTWHEYGHPLLASWGKQGRDFIALLHEHDRGYRAGWTQIDVFRDFLDTHDEPDFLDTHDAPTQRDFLDTHDEPTLLRQLQQDIYELNPAPMTEAERRALPETRSIRFVSAYGAMREVEVLRDRLLDTFAELPDLEPRDVIVFSPEIERYAPLIEAAFGSIPRSDPRFIPFSIADVTPRGRDPYLRAVELLLALPESRLTASDVLDLLEVPAFRARFAIVEEELPVLTRWLREAGVRWGLDAAHRESLGFNASDLNTWQHGLDRMLLGYAAGSGCASDNDAPWRDTVPYAEVAGNDADLAGRLHGCLRALAGWRDRLAAPRAPHAWAETLRGLMDALLARDATSDRDAHGAVDATLESWLATTARADFTAPLTLTVVREVLAASLDERHASQRFMAGSVNFCSFLPMRAVPFRVVALLGMNDGTFPRQRPAPDFDLLDTHWRPGDRSRRTDDRYLFLEALLAARERVIVTWTGRDPQTDAPKPPSVLVDELRDHLDRGWRADAGPVPALLTEEHPLHPFSKRYFTAGDPTPPTYASEWARPDIETSNADLPPAPAPAEAVTPTELARFMKYPARTFFGGRLGVRLDLDETTIPDDERWTLGPLEQFGLKSTLFELAGETDLRSPALAHRLIREGGLPTGALAEIALGEHIVKVEALLEHYREAVDGCDEATWRAEIALPLAGGELKDWIADLRGPRDAPRLVTVRPNDLAKREYYWIEPWVRQMAACAAGVPLTAVLVGEDRAWELPPVPEDIARDRLDALIALRQRGLAEPLPLEQHLAFGYLRKDLDEARKQYEGDNGPTAPPGIAERERALSRAFPRFDDLLDADFEELTIDLYGPLWEDLRP